MNGIEVAIVCATCPGAACREGINPRQFGRAPPRLVCYTLN
jgi:hypothetical protein